MRPGSRVSGDRGRGRDSTVTLTPPHRNSRSLTPSRDMRPPETDIGKGLRSHLLRRGVDPRSVDQNQYLPTPFPVGGPTLFVDFQYPLARYYPTGQVYRTRLVGRTSRHTVVEATTSPVGLSLNSLRPPVTHQGPVSRHCRKTSVLRQHGPCSLNTGPLRHDPPEHTRPGP